MGGKAPYTKSVYGLHYIEEVGGAGVWVSVSVSRSRQRLAPGFFRGLKEGR
jgi:hypothetical protein